MFHSKHLKHHRPPSTTYTSNFSNRQPIHHMNLSFPWAIHHTDSFRPACRPRTISTLPASGKQPLQRPAKKTMFYETSLVLTNYQTHPLSFSLCYSQTWPNLLHTHSCSPFHPALIAGNVLGVQQLVRRGVFAQAVLRRRARIHEGLRHHWQTGVRDAALVDVEHKLGVLDHVHPEPQR